MHRWEWGKGRLKRIYSNSATWDKDEFLADSEEENENVVEDVHVIPLEILEARFDRNDIIVECISWVYQGVCVWLRVKSWALFEC